MDEIAVTIGFYAAALLYPAVTGPVAAYALVLILRRKSLKLMLAYWPVLLAAHVAAFLLMAGSAGDLSWLSFVTCFVTPMFAVSTALGLRIASRRLAQDIREDPARRTWLVIGTFLIPLMQVATVGTWILLAPAL